jgi:hypothetical protein
MGDHTDFVEIVPGNLKIIRIANLLRMQLLTDIGAVTCCPTH